MALSNGALVEILNNGRPESPLLQVINAKKISNAASPDRYRLMLSDGVHTYSHSMLAAQMNKFFENDEVCNSSIIRMKKYMCNTLNDKKVLIVLDMEVVQRDANEKIGNPTALNPTNIPTLDEARRNGALPSADRPAPVQQSNAARQGTTNAFRPTSGVNGTQGTPGKSIVHPIASLTPYQNRWRIRARVSLKNNPRTWSNSRGEGKLFSCNLMDESGEIRMTGFNDAVDKYYEMLELNKVYYVQRCQLKTANKQYSNVKNDYEMTINNDTIIEPCLDDDGAMPELKYDFIPIASLEKVKPNDNVDIIGIVKQVNDVGSVTSRSTQKELSKRDIFLVDQSGVQVSCTLWGEDAIKFDGQGFPVMALRGARVSDYGGRTLSVSGNTAMLLNPDMAQAHDLRGWWDAKGRNADFSAFASEGGGGGGSQQTNWKTFIQVKSENMGMGEKGDYYSTKGTIMFLKRDNCMYKACPTEQCNKKLIDQGNGMHRCEKCNQEFPNFKWRMILQANVADHSENVWATCFQESAETIIGMSAQDFGTLRERDEAQFDSTLREAHFKQYNFKMRAKMENYNDESRLKTVCVGIKPVDWVEHGKRLLGVLDSMGI